MPNLSYHLHRVISDSQTKTCVHSSQNAPEGSKVRQNSRAGFVSEGGAHDYSDFEENWVLRENGLSLSAAYLSVAAR
jgi:hypothetical protein